MERIMGRTCVRCTVCPLASRADFQTSPLPLTGDHLTLLAVYEAWKAAKFSNPWCHENFLQVRGYRQHCMCLQSTLHACTAHGPLASISCKACYHLEWLLILTRPVTSIALSFLPFSHGRCTVHRMCASNSWPSWTGMQHEKVTVLHARVALLATVDCASICGCC